MTEEEEERKAARAAHRLFDRRFSAALALGSAADVLRSGWGDEDLIERLREIRQELLDRRIASQQSSKI